MDGRRSGQCRKAPRLTGPGVQVDSSVTAPGHHGAGVFRPGRMNGSVDGLGLRGEPLPARHFSRGSYPARRGDPADRRGTGAMLPVRLLGRRHGRAGGSPRAGIGRPHGDRVGACHHRRRRLGARGAGLEARARADPRPAAGSPPDRLPRAGDGAGLPAPAHACPAAGLGRPHGPARRHARRGASPAATWHGSRNRPWCCPVAGATHGSTWSPNACSRSCRTPGRWPSRSAAT